MYNVKSRIL